MLALTAGCAMFSSKEQPAEPKIAKEPSVPIETVQPSVPIETSTPLAPKTAEKPRRPKVQKITPPAPRIRKKHKPLTLPTHINPKDQSLMVLVNKGEYLVGGKLSSDQKSAVLPGLQEVALQDFYIDQYEVTVEKYKKYDLKYDEKLFTDNQECLACPAMGIEWKRADHYCRWAGKRLPTEQEWEAAARGPGNNHHWPWGDKWIARHANVLGEEDGFDKAAPAGSFPLGASPSGAMDLIGNVWEWVSSTHPAPEKGDGKTLLHTVKGGSWRNAAKVAKISYRHMVKPDFKNPTFGFRCAKNFK